MIDKDEAIRLLRKEVANAGADYVYDRSAHEGMCVYFGRDKAPACIVGHAFASHGITRIDIGTRNIVGVVDQFNDIMDRDAAQVFVAAQNAQDSGHSWGYALEQAEARYKRLGGTE